MTSTAKAPAAPAQSRVSEGIAGHNGSTDTGNQATAVTPESIPTALRPLRQWVTWKLEHREGRYTKVPYHERGRARSNSPQTGITAPLAMTMYRNGAGRYAGIGFMLSADDPFAVLDLDDCRDPETGTIEPWAQQIIDEMATYTEPSPTGTGVHIWARATKPGPRCRKDNIEIYEHSRFVTVTGQRLPGTPATIEPRQEQLNDLYSRVFPDNEQPRNTAPAGVSHLEDDQLIEKIRGSAQGPKFDRLWSGDTSGHKSSSDADGSMTMLLAFWTNRDPAQMDRIFRRSHLLRPKWDEQRGAETYGERTVRTALAKMPEGYSPTNNGPAVVRSHDATAPTESRAGVNFEGLDACTSRVAELEAENRTLRAENVRLKHVENLHSLQWQVWGNPDISGTEKAVAMATLSVVEHAPKDRRDEKGRVKTWRSEIARKAGVSEDTASRTLKKGVLADAGLFELDVETVRVERADPRTGEIRAMPTQQWYIRPTAEPVELLERMRTIRKPEDAPKHGGAHAKGCPQHPDAPVRVTTITMHECCACDRMLDRKRTTHNIIPDIPIDDDYLLEEDASDLWPQDAAVETDPTQTVVSLYTPQVAAIGPADLRQQDAGTVLSGISQQRRRQPYPGEVLNLYVHGGNDD